MSATTSASATSTAGGSFLDLLDGPGGTAKPTGETVNTLLASIATAFASFGIQFLAFALLRLRLTRIYRPKSYLVAERQRVPEPPSGIYQWLIPLFTTPNSVFIERCGLDAYFFLRYLRMLLKIFFPLALLLLPILLPVNRFGGGVQKGIDRLGWQNNGPQHRSYLWAQLLLSIVVIGWVCYVIYDELRGYIRIRQAYLTSPQHRIRASATTVLVSGIPRKWLTVEALDGLYDVFPGGIRNIWINRNFDELYTKVQQRDKIARKLESAETSLIRKCFKKHKKAEEQKRKQKGMHRMTKEEKRQEEADENAEADRLAQTHGISSGDLHTTPHNMQEALSDIDLSSRRREKPVDRSFRNPLSMVGQGLGAVGNGFGALGHVGKNFVGDITGGINNVVKTVNQEIDGVNAGDGFVASDSPYQSPPPQSESFTTRAIKPQQSTQAGPRARQNEDRNTIRFAQSDAQDERTDNVGKSGFRDDDSASDQGPPVPPKMDSIDEALSDDNGDSFDNLRPKHSVKRPADVADQKQPSGPMARLMKFRKPPPIDFPSPMPHTADEGEEFPMHDLGPHAGSDLNEKPEQRVAKSKWAEYLSKVTFWKKKNEEPEIKEVYPQAFEDHYAEDQDGEPLWKKYILPKDRDTLREPVMKHSWFPRLPFVGTKIDKIYYLRKELARLNVEIELDQKNPEKYPFMNSAFIQFNHQVAAHMACQSLSHHVPQHMTPRLVEISPGDVLWGNMSIKWWERYIRSGIVIAVCVGIIVLYAVPVTFTGLLSQISTLAQVYPWLAWLARAPKTVIAIIQGVLPPLFLSIILILVPIIFRALIKFQGVPTGTDKELGVQSYYFFFLFIQVFLIVTLSSGLTKFITAITQNATAIATQLAADLPGASDYFFSYMIVQAMSNSASSLLQATTLLFWFVLGPVLDSTARQKWRRQVNLQRVQWGSYFPPFTNFAVIGLVYSVISPFIMVFNLITFSLFWISERYNILYVYQFDHDTGGLLFPQAVNQLFTGLYVMELCLIGLFFTSQDVNQNVACIPQGVIMIVLLVATILFQVLLNNAFRPLFRYLPITLEDEAVIRDEEFARAQDAKWHGLTAEETEGGVEIEDQLEARERQEQEEDDAAEERERWEIQARRGSRQVTSPHGYHLEGSSNGVMQTKPQHSWKQDPWKKAISATREQPAAFVRRFAGNHERQRSQSLDSSRGDSVTETEQHNAGGKPRAVHTTQQAAHDVEAQQAVGDILFSGYADELEDLTPQERDTLVRYSFQHAALRARRPVIWIPRDHLGVSADEIQRCQRMSTVPYADGEGEKGETKTNIWISNDGTALDAKGKVVFRRSPPDFANVDLIAL